MTPKRWWNYPIRIRDGKPVIVSESTDVTVPSRIMTLEHCTIVNMRRDGKWALDELTQ